MTVSMPSVPCPFLPDGPDEPGFIPDDHAFDDIPTDPALTPSTMEVAMLRRDLRQIREAFPERSKFAVIDLDCCLLLALQFSRSEIHGFDLMVLLFLVAHFDHRQTVVRFTLTEIARQLDRDVSQVRRAMRKLEQLHWARFNRRGSVELSPAIVRSANSRYQAIHFRHANTPFRRDR